MIKKKKYIKPIIEVIRVHICCQMLSENDGILHHSDTQTDIGGPASGGDEKHDGGDDISDAVKINYWEQKNTALGVNN